MYFAILLHIYQPPTQFPRVLRVIVERSYLEIIKALKTYPRARITLNIPAALIEQLKEHGYDKLITDLTDLVRGGQVELTGSAAYHPLLFRLPNSEIVRQIRLNERSIRQAFGDVWVSRGFFAPEMAVDERVLKVVEECGYEWVILENPKSKIQPSFAKATEGAPRSLGEVGQMSNKIPASPVGRPNPKNTVFRRKGGKLKIVFRNRKLSLGVAFGKTRTIEDLITVIRGNRLLIGENPVLALDGETFGWHQPGQLELLKSLFRKTSEADSEFSLVTVSELVRKLPVGLEFEVGRTSWGERVKTPTGVYYPRWEDPDNEIHQMQWELTDLAIKAVQSSKFRVSNPESVTRYTLCGMRAEQKQWLEARRLLDKALHSDQYWWAEGKTVWHPGMVERGASMLRDVVMLVPDVGSDAGRQASAFYDRIIGAKR